MTELLPEAEKRYRLITEDGMDKAYDAILAEKN